MRSSESQNEGAMNPECGLTTRIRVATATYVLPTPASPGFEYALKEIGGQIDADISRRLMMNRLEDRQRLIDDILDILVDKKRITGDERKLCRKLKASRNRIVHKEFSTGFDVDEYKGDSLPSLNQISANRYINEVVDIIEKLYRGSAYS